jgi:Ferredoxin-like domain in Api92-like protein
MPNWVYNHLTIDGSKEDIAKVKAQVGATVKTKYKSADELDEVIDREPIFSFMNILPPPEDKLDEYHAVHGYADGKKSGDTEYNWYNFNVREWGTKWDARDVELLDDDETYLHYKFDTAWSPPTEVIAKLAEQNPNLDITLEYREEQGWGGEINFNGSTAEVVKEWDVPDTHAEEIAVNNEYCWRCENFDGDYSDLYQDCPENLKPIEIHAKQDLVLTKEK